jgi:hypothetical protein
MPGRGLKRGSRVADPATAAKVCLSSHQQAVDNLFAVRALGALSSLDPKDAGLKFLACTSLLPRLNQVSVQSLARPSRGEGHRYEQVGGRKPCVGRAHSVVRADFARQTQDGRVCGSLDDYRLDNLSFTLRRSTWSRFWIGSSPRSVVRGPGKLDATLGPRADRFQ